MAVGVLLTGLLAHCVLQIAVTISLNLHKATLLASLQSVLDRELLPEVLCDLTVVYVTLGVSDTHKKAEILIINPLQFFFANLIVQRAVNAGWRVVFHRHAVDEALIFTVAGCNDTIRTVHYSATHG